MGMEGIWGEMGVGEELGKAGQRDRGMERIGGGEQTKENGVQSREGGDQEEVCSVSAD